MFRWYVINTYSGHENKVKANLEHRVKSMSKEEQVRRVVVPTESVVETKDGQKVQTERRLWPGYVLVNMDLTDDAWTLVKNTPGVTGFVGSQNKPVPLSQPEVDRMEGQTLSADEVRALGDLPPKDVLQAQVVGAIAGPVQGAYNVLAAPLREFLVVLDQYIQKKEAAEAA